MSQPQTNPTAFPNLQGHEFMKLTTFRKAGNAVPTPVWFAQEGERLFVVTQQDAGKVKRIRHTARVTVEPCTARGESLGAMLEARARELPPELHQTADKALNRKYGWMKRMFDLASMLRGNRRTYLEIVPA
jgi:PPOX class probable F420-dependent enzyme